MGSEVAKAHSSKNRPQPLIPFSGHWLQIGGVEKQFDSVRIRLVVKEIINA